MPVAHVEGGIRSGEWGMPEEINRLVTDAITNGFFTTRATWTTARPSPSCCAPQPYLEFNYLVRHARGVTTDSGGVTEETTVMGVPCVTLRGTTERPETVSIGTNELIGTDPGGAEAGARPPVCRALEEGGDSREVGWASGGEDLGGAGEAADSVDARSEAPPWNLLEHL